MTPLQHLINFWPHPQGIVKVHLCVGTQELRERYHLSSAPKIGKRCPMGTERRRAPRGNKNRGNRGIKFEKTEQLRVSRFGLAVRRWAGKRKDLGSIPLRLSFLFKKVAVCGHCLVTLSITSY